MKRILSLVLVIALCLLCTACSTSAGTNMASYFSNTKDILSILFSSKVTSEGKESEETIAIAQPLDSPTNLTIAEDGTFSFTGVENADYYLMYFCAPDTAKDDDSFLYSSAPIPSDNGAGTYTGSCLDVINAAYGEYLIRVTACPALGDTEYSMSAPAEETFIASGVQATPSLEYFWDPFTDTLNLQLSNINDYTYQAYPAKLEVTCTNVNNEDDQVTATLEGVAMDNLDFSVVLTQGETYTITAHAVSDSQYVTNTVTEDVVVAEAFTMGDMNAHTPAYSYSHGYINYPLIWENFDLQNGGSFGPMVGQYASYTFECTPRAGAAYSYDMTVFYIDLGKGALELYEDGTCLFYQTGWAFISPSSIEGIWIDNGDGTATLCFNHSSLTFT